MLKRTIKNWKVLMSMAAVILSLGLLMTGCGERAGGREQEEVTFYGGQENKADFLAAAENGVYMGFSDIDQYTDLAAAVEKGCYVIHDGELYGGREHWQAFLEAAGKGEDARLRVVHSLYPMIGEGKKSKSDEAELYYNDLYYCDGKYYYFDYNGADDIRVSGPYIYLRKLTGMDGIPRKERHMYVLTDSLELTYRDVTWSFLSSDLRTVTKIPFTWLGFTTYLRED